MSSRQLTGAGRHLVDEVLGPGAEVITAAVVAPAPHAAAAVRPRRLGAALLYLGLVHDHGRRRGDHGEVKTVTTGCHYTSLHYYTATTRSRSAQLHWKRFLPVAPTWENLLYPRECCENFAVAGCCSILSLRSHSLLSFPPLQSSN